MRKQRFKLESSSLVGIDVSGMPTAPELSRLAQQLDSIEYVNHIHKINPGNGGRPIDIRKAKQMTQADFMAAGPRDIEMLLRYGVSQNQVARQYGVPIGSLTRLFKQKGVDTTLPLRVKEKFDTRKPEELEHTSLPSQQCDSPPVTPDKIITDPAKIAELIEPEPEPVPQITWFYGLPRSGAIPTLTVYEDNRIALPTVIRKQYGAKRIRIGVTNAPVNIIIGETDKSEFGVKIADKQSRVRCDGICQMLKDKGILLPAKFKMVRDESAGLWSGTLLEP